MTPVPGPRGFAENLRAAFWMRGQTLEFLEQAHAKWGPAFQIGLGSARVMLVHRPEDIKAVLLDDAASFEKSARIKAVSRVVIGEGIFTAEGEKWKRQRRIVQPLFNRTAVSGFVPTMAGCAQAMLDRVEAHARAQQTFDGAAEVTRMALGVALRCFFGVDDPTKLAEFGEAVEFIGTHANDRVVSMLPLADWVPTPGNLRFRRYARAMRAFAAQLIAARRLSGAMSDLVGRLLAARDESTGEALDEQQIIDELLTFYVAGHDTTANSLAFTLDALARHPEAQQRVRDEVVRVLGRRTPGPDDLPRLTYTMHVLEESMRLYPPGWAFVRTARADTTVAGLPVSRGTNVFLNIWFAQRDPAVWERPLEFDPDRFEESRAAKRPRLSYLPFGAGQRQCIGAGFSLAEGQVALAMLLRDYQLEPAGDPAQPWARSVLTPRHGVPLRARAVAASNAAVA